MEGPGCFSFDDYDNVDIIGGLSDMLNVNPDKKRKFVDFCLELLFSATSDDFNTPDEWFLSLDSTISKKMLQFRDELEVMHEGPGNCFSEDR